MPTQYFNTTGVYIYYYYVIIVVFIIIIIIIIIIIEWLHIDFYQQICFSFDVWCQQDSSHLNNFLEDSAGMYQDGFF